MGVLGLLLTSRMRYRAWQRLAVPLLAITLFQLALVLHPTAGVTAYGSSRWIALGPVTSQPSEIAKLALVVFAATILTLKWGRLHDIGHLALPLAPVCFVVFGMVMLHPDLGTTVILAGTVFVLLFAAGVRLRYLLATAVVSSAVGMGLIFSADYRRVRFLSFLNPWADAKNTGYQLGQRFCSNNPIAIKQLHYDYFKAGADCVITGSYQATIEGFMKRGLTEEQAINLIKKSVRLAIEARDEFWNDEANRVGRSKPFVAASVGPYGAFLADGSEYRGNYGLTEKELMDFHRPRVRALIEAGADMLACETVPTPIEARALVKLLGEFEGVSAWISFSCRDEAHVCEGETLETCIRQVESSPQVAAVGVNCTSPRYIPSLIHEAKRATDKPILLYPNSGESYNAEKKDWNDDPVFESFGEEARGCRAAVVLPRRNAQGCAFQHG